MSKPIIHFAHANGFPVGSYSEILSALENDYRIIYKDILAHDDRFPVERGWRSSADELIEFIESNTDEPVIGVGHSFGATITFMAASKRPELFKSIVLMDPVIVLGRFPTSVARALRKLNLLGKITPADKTSVRKRRWTSREEALQYFRSKPLFKNFTESSLQAYVESGLVETDSGFDLRFQVPAEVQIYRCVPLDLDGIEPITPPGLVIRGKTTDVARTPFMRRLSKKHGLQLEQIEGGHMFPFENPVEVVEIIRSTSTFG